MELFLTGREWSELGSRDIDGKAERPSERARTSQWIVELGIYDYRHRFYQPQLGRFLQADPTGFDAGDMNLFRYCDDDPVDGSDPTGLVNTNAGTTLEERMRLFYGSGDTGGGLYDLNVNNSRTFSLAQINITGEAVGQSKGLKYGFDRYPEKGPGGRSVVERALKRLGRTPNGRAFQQVNRRVTIRGVDREHPTGSYVGTKTGNHYLYLDPTDSRFYDAVTFNRISHFKGETIPDSDEGRAALIGHEFGHLLYGYGKDIDSEIRNVRYNENPIRDQLEIFRRPSYLGNYVPNP